LHLLRFLPALHLCLRLHPWLLLLLLLLQRRQWVLLVNNPALQLSILARYLEGRHWQKPVLQQGQHCW
jgi:hypothetical protein